MPDNLHLVYSQPPAGLPDEEFNRWYDEHLHEILSVPGFESARRFRLEAMVTGVGGPAPYRYLSLYEIEGDPAEAVAQLENAGLSSADSYAELKEDDAGDLALPDWFDQVGFASWNCTAIGPPAAAAAGDLHIVFSRPPVGVSDEEFDRWYEMHAGEILRVAGFVSVRRFRLEPVVFKGGAPLPYNYLSVYGIDGNPDVVMAELEREVEAAWMDLPDWFQRAVSEGCFASWNCISVGDRVTAP